MEKFYNIGVPPTIKQIIAFLYQVGLWNIGKEKTFKDRGRQLFYFLYFLLFFISTALGAYVANDNDESIFLTVASIMVAVQLYRLSYIIRREMEIRSLTNEVGTHCSIDQKEFIEMDDKLKSFMILPKFLIFGGCVAIVFALVSPVATNEWKLLFNIGFISDYEHRSATEFWMAYVFIAGGICMSLICCSVTIIVWYSMLSFVIKYKLLGNQIRNMGKDRAVPYHRDFIAAIETHEKINGFVDSFSSMFSSLFLFQIFTSSVCICGSIYTLAFSSHDNLIQDGMNCVIIGYGLFDIAMVTYLGNEIMLSSDRLSYCLFESTWYEQTQSCKKLILIVGELLKKPKELVVGMLFPLNLETFTLIVKRAYSLFNVLLGLRK